MHDSVQYLAESRWSTCVHSIVCQAQQVAKLALCLSMPLSYVVWVQLQSEAGAGQAAGVERLAASHPALAMPVRRHLTYVTLYDNECKTLANCLTALSSLQVR